MGSERFVTRCEFNRLLARIANISGGGGTPYVPANTVVQLTVDPDSGGLATGITTINVPQMNGKAFNKVLVELTGYGPLLYGVEYDISVVGGGINLLGGRTTQLDEIYTFSIFD